MFKRVFFNSFINRVILYDDKVIILYNSNDRETKRLNKKQLKEVENAKNLEEIKENSLEPQGFKRVSLGGVLAFLYTPDLFLEADFSACFAVLSTSSILSGNRFLVICWSVKLKVMTTLSLYKITSRIKFLTINFLAPLLSISPHTAF